MIRAENFYVVRTPLLPVNIVTQLHHISHASLAPVIKAIFRDEFLQEAIYIASPELYQELQKWLATDSENQKLASALYRYLLRMSSRCTPYGLFAGCATGGLSDHTAIQLNDKQLHKKHCRLDMNYVAELTAVITAVPAIREQLLYYPNNSLYAAGTQYRYAAYSVKNKIRNYYLTAVNYSSYLEKMLETASTGATLTDIRNSIVSEEEDISAEEAAAFTEELLQNQLLVSELEPTVTGEEFFIHLVNRLKNLEHTEETTALLTAIQSMLNGQQTGTAKYTTTHELVQSLLTETSNKDLVQTDLFLSTEKNTLSHTVINELSAQVAQLWKLASNDNNSDLRQFCDAFRQRYEEQEIPLSLALDSEAGIGYGAHSQSNTDHTPLVDHIHVPPRNTAATSTRSKLQDFQLQQLHQCLKENKKVITLTRDHLESFREKETPSLPHSMYLMGSILSNSAAAIDNGDYLFDMNGCSGPSAANLLGRFCHGDEELAAHVKACLKAEEASDPEKIYAEIIHLPESRTGNILMRPRLREYEIVYLANSLAPEEYQLHLSDLMVSVQRNKVVLRSRRLNKIIVPRLSTAHNYRQGLPVYKFLCDLQFQDYHTGIGWHWQIPGEVSFYPRVQYGNIILSKSTWMLHKKTYPALAKATPEKYMEIFREIRAQLELPRYVVVKEGDNELPADLENEVAVQLLVTTLLKKEQVTLQEFLHTPENCWINGPDGAHTNEFIIPLRNISSEKEKKQTTEIITAHTATPQRKFSTGSEWLYVKLYAGTRSAENILKEKILPLTQELMQENIIDQWFFIRYTDPEHHLRIRFHHSTNPHFWSTVLERLHAVLATDSIYRIQTDTYEREIERYGASTMLFSEAVFHYDSTCVIGILDLLEEEEGENYRWMLALRGVDMLLDDFGYTLAAKSALLKMLQKSFFEEFSGEKPLLVQLNDKYREEMRKVSSVLDPLQDGEHGIEAAVACFQTRSAQIQQQLAGVQLTNRDDLLCSYIHMFLNRLLLSNQRKHELVIYHFLSRYYESMLAISKKQLKAITH
ncbi:thiopeptide-type bacteriocin biosynthesis domain-containing protein [Chitinophaga ginsengisegetis]|uniref:Thiopeptide-type bacteriocin biosynthesis domain-containing protein n=1 Tax=Chitinophaga ginsengisegetis TaxID=393003 RepID=A0A1T5PAX4_9BACT|nr:lantibiotic dehydratase [Chitinophaga ginsengisegetis]SKD09826.1 thiopeptide-type bacteriocin biosynthesis domain-containing protein [Chitinophaga ginsengisegetis]